MRLYELTLLLFNFYLDENTRNSCSLCIGAMVRTNSELFTNYGNLLVPFLLIAMQEEGVFVTFT